MFFLLLDRAKFTLHVSFDFDGSPYWTCPDVKLVTAKKARIWEKEGGG